jgi:hypothetical protein
MKEEGRDFIPQTKPRPHPFEPESKNQFEWEQMQGFSKDWVVRITGG